MAQGELEHRIGRYEGQCACGVAMVTGLAATAALLCAYLFSELPLPPPGWRMAAWFAAAIVGGNILGKVAGTIYFRFMAYRLRRRLSAEEGRLEGGAQIGRLKPRGSLGGG